MSRQETQKTKRQKTKRQRDEMIFLIKATQPFIIARNSDEIILGATIG